MAVSRALARQISLLLCLLSLATSAHAEGAWVLWSQSLSINLDDLKKSEVRPLSWDPIDASAKGERSRGWGVAPALFICPTWQYRQPSPT